MSSSNLVSVNYLKEVDYGVRQTPGPGINLKTARFTSESLSGTPTTTESGELRTDRMSGGQVATGLDVNGDINFELSNDEFFDDFFEAAMMSTWVAAETVNTSASFVLDGSDPQKGVLTLGAEFANLVPGVLGRIALAGGTINFTVISVDTPSTVFTVAVVRDQADFSETADVTIPQHVDIGSTQTSFLLGKAYKDVIHALTTDEHSQTYEGELVSGFSIEAAYGEIMTGVFSFLGNGYTQEPGPSYAQQVVAAGGSIQAAGTSNPINSSIDVPLVIVGGVATDFCIESLSVELDNGLTARNCIGKAAPTGYELGTAAINISASIYLSDTAYDAFMPGKLSQEAIDMTYVAENVDGGYAFQVTAVQLSFPDPAATGQNEATTLEATGTGKVGPNGTSALRIYKL